MLHTLIQPGDFIVVFNSRTTPTGINTTQTRFFSNREINLLEHFYEITPAVGCPVFVLKCIAKTHLNEFTWECIKSKIPDPKLYHSPAPVRETSKTTSKYE